MSTIADHLAKFERAFGDETVIDHLLADFDGQLPNINAARRPLATVFNAAPFLRDCAARDLFVVR